MNLCKRVILIATLLVVLKAVPAVADEMEQQVVGTITRWQSQDGPDIVERFAGQSPTGDLLVFLVVPAS